MFRSNDLIADFERLTKGLNLRLDLDKAVDDIAKAFADVPVHAQNESTATGEKLGSFAAGPGTDAIRYADRLELVIDLPGVDPADVDITIAGRSLAVHATRSFVVPDDAEQLHQGRDRSDFHRTWQLPDDLNAEEMSARSDHGVLTITVPVEQGTEPRRIKVTVNDD